MFTVICPFFFVAVGILFARAIPGGVVAVFGLVFVRVGDGIKLVGIVIFIGGGCRDRRARCVRDARRQTWSLILDRGRTRWVR